jgi:lipoprotein-anchoring transpeptidase ErfK/SrfK
MVRSSWAPPFVAMLALAACNEHRLAPAPASSAAASETPPAQPDAATDPSQPDAAAQDAGPFAGPWLGATVLQTPVMSDMEWEKNKEAKVVRLGYLRYGERVPVLPEPHKKANCADGWYELLAGGFVCGKYATLDIEHPKFRSAHPPDMTGPLPYTYGANVANGTPLYRSVPSRADRLKLEPWLRPRKPKPPEDESGPSSGGASTTPDAGAGDVLSAVATDRQGNDDTPWWQRETPDGGPPSVTLEDLQETGGPIVRRMVKGFFLSLDRQFPAGNTTWWRTVAGLVAPVERIFVTKPATEYHGVWLGKDDASFATTNVPSRRIDKIPVAFVMNGHAHKWSLDDSRKHVSVLPGELDHFQAVGLTDEQVNLGGYDFWETDEGWWLRAVDATRTEPGPAPDRLGENEKWIDVNLKRQTLVAFEGATPVYVTVFSSGRNEHETVNGSFRIREKHITATMDGDSDIASDGPYSIEDVPYIQYFNGSYALHGAFWHASFGYVKSHGCVNLSPWDAKELFGWTDPQLPEGWHAVLSTKEKPGTRVIVHGKGQGTCLGPKLDACEKLRP